MITALGVAEEKDLSELTLEQLQQFSDLITADVFDKALTLEASVNARDLPTISCASRKATPFFTK
jgi:argininosuccinate lyase